MKSRSTYFDYWIGSILLNCWVYFEEGDKTTGQESVAYLERAYVADSMVDISGLLDARIRAKIEEEAAYHLSRGE